LEKPFRATEQNLSLRSKALTLIRNASNPGLKHLTERGWWPRGTTSARAGKTALPRDTQSPCLVSPVSALSLCRNLPNRHLALIFPGFIKEPFGRESLSPMKQPEGLYASGGARHKAWVKYTGLRLGM